MPFAAMLFFCNVCNIYQNTLIISVCLNTVSPTIHSEGSMNLRQISIDLVIGQRIQLGSHVATITKIEQHSSGDISIGTTRGSRKVLTFRLLPDAPTVSSVPADKYR
jgi:hypothetical protein